MKSTGRGSWLTDGISDARQSLPDDHLEVRTSPRLSVQFDSSPRFPSRPSIAPSVPGFIYPPALTGGSLSFGITLMVAAPFPIASPMARVETNAMRSPVCVYSPPSLCRNHGVRG